MNIPPIHGIEGVFSLVNSITGGMWGFGVCVAIGLITLFSLYNDYREKAFVASGLAALTAGLFFSLYNWINPVWILMFLAWTAISIILARRAQST